MRAILAGVLALLLVVPAAAEDSLGDQLAAAEDVFMLGLGPGAMADGSYYRQLIQGLDGTWVVRRMLGSLAPGQPVGTAAEKACAMAPTTISTATPLAIAVTDGRPGRMMTLTYAYIGGATFVPLFDMKAFLDMQGATAPDRLTISALGSAVERVAIYRPSPDVLVMVPPAGDPVMFLRCGGVAAPGASDRAALLTEPLGRSFDEQFPGTTDPAIRQRFIACALAAMAPLDEADVELLAESNFKPSNEELARIQQTYPQVSEGAQACAQEASGALKPPTQ
jgi:hypothetical protein